MTLSCPGVTRGWRARSLRKGGTQTFLAALGGTSHVSRAWKIEGRSRCTVKQGLWAASRSLSAEPKGSWLPLLACLEHPGRDTSRVEQ